MRDGPFRAALKAVAATAYLSNLQVWRAWLRFRHQWPWELGGECGSCAQCCEAPGIQLSGAVWHLRPLRRVFTWWQRVVNGFELTGEIPLARALVFRCTHFDAVTRRCDSYDTRPGMCRDYPRLVLHQANPHFMERCGHRAVLGSGREMLRVLQDQPLTAEQRKKLEKALRLR